MKTAQFTETRGRYTITVELYDSPSDIMIDFYACEHGSRDIFARIIFDKRAEFTPTLRKCGLRKYIIADVYGGDAGIIDYARRLIS